MSPRTLALARAASALGLGALAAHAQGIQYTITDVSGPQSISAIGSAGLSDSGNVVGWCHANGGPFPEIGFLSSPRGFLLPSAPTGVAWVSFTADDVNDAGTFIGSFGTSGTSLTRGYRCKEGVSAELLTPLGNRAYPHAINTAGWIVGMAGAWPGGTHAAVIWDPDLNASWLPGFDDPAAINDRGQVVGGRIEANGNETGFLFDNGNLIPLGSLDPTHTGSVTARAIDGFGNVVGVSVVATHDHAFFWNASTGMTELPGLGIDAFPHNVGALDMNDSGWIVGYAPNSQGQTDVLWAPDHTVRELRPLIPDFGPNKNWVNMSVLRINAAGQIAAIAANALLGLDWRTVVLTPANLRASALVPNAAGVTNTLHVSGATPGKLAVLAEDREDPLDRGYTPIPGCEPLGLAMAAPRVVAVAIADASGVATFEWSVPSSLAGARVRLQAFQRAACALSNVVHVAF
jgi:probable HAF family extracellular repeat protein